MKIKYLFVFMVLSSFINAQSAFDVEGHRGCRGLLPENTIPAFIHAIDLGVNTLEMDMVISKDGKIVISHDPVMNETICTNPDGKPVTADEKDKLKIYSLTYDEIKKFDCGLRGNPKFPDQKKMAVHKPLLSEVIDTVEQYVKTHHLPAVKYNIETKTTPAGDGIYHPRPKEFVQMVYDLIKQKGVANRCILQSFDRRTLQEMHRLDSTITTALLIESLESFDTQLEKLGFKPDIYSPNYLMVTPKLIRQCHSRGIKILPWTVNDEKKMAKLKRMGVDGIISDYPDRLIKVTR
jgi:glycerophosphoryl diester phosphodiesterase